VRCERTEKRTRDPVREKGGRTVRSQSEKTPPTSSFLSGEKKDHMGASRERNRRGGIRDRARLEKKNFDAGIKRRWRLKKKKHTAGPKKDRRAGKKKKT